MELFIYELVLVCVPTHTCTPTWSTCAPCLSEHMVDIISSPAGRAAWCRVQANEFRSKQYKHCFVFLSLFYYFFRKSPISLVVIYNKTTEPWLFPWPLKNTWLIHCGRYWWYHMNSGTKYELKRWITLFLQSYFWGAWCHLMPPLWTHLCIKRTIRVSEIY